MNILTLCLIGAGSYLIGSIPSGYLIGRFRGIDIRTVGSCNIGATNVTRVIGKGAGRICFLCDFLKGALPVLLAEYWSTDPWIGVTACVCAVLGHMFPIFLKFKGGKGISTAAGGALALSPFPLLIALAVWVVTFYASRYVSLASITAAAALPLSAWIFYLGSDRIPLAFVIIFTIIGALAIYRHRTNIKRLLNGTENRFARPEKKKEEK